MSKEGYFGLAIGLLAIAMGVFQGMYPIIPPIVGWPIIAVLGIITFILCDIGIRKKEYERHAKQHIGIEQETKFVPRIQQTQERQIVESQKGSLDSVTTQDRVLIIQLGIDMIINHGHMDMIGLLADRASGIPLNELITRNCSICGIPRNQESKD